jgi:hypothetical protein
VNFGAVTVVSEIFPSSVFKAAEKSCITESAKHPLTLKEECNSQEYAVYLGVMLIEHPGLGKLTGL